MSPELLLQGRETSVVIVIPLLVLALAVFLTRTRTGLMVRAAAANPEKARLVGIRLFRTSSVVWAISAALAAVAAITLAPVRGVSLAGAAAAGGTLSYQLLLRALVVALIARMRSLPVTLVAGIGVGIVEVILQQNVDPSDLGVTELWLFVATLVMVLLFSRRAAAPDDGGWKVGDDGPGAASWTRQHRGGHGTRPRLGVVALFAVLIVIPIFFSRASQSFLWTRVLVFAIAGCSLTILTGWAGQLSLGQFGFAAVGGLTTVKLVGDDGVLGLHNLPWGVAVALGVLVGAVVAVLIGLPALRVPGSLPRGHHAGVRGVRVGVAGRAGHVRRPQRSAAHAGQARCRHRRLLRRAAPTTTCASSCSRSVSRSSRSSGGRASVAR